MTDGGIGSKTHANIMKGAITNPTSPTAVTEGEGLVLPKPGRHTRYGRSMDLTNGMQTRNTGNMHLATTKLPPSQTVGGVSKFE